MGPDATPHLAGPRASRAGAAPAASSGGRTCWMAVNASGARVAAGVADDATGGAMAEEGQPQRVEKKEEGGPQRQQAEGVRSRRRAERKGKEGERRPSAGAPHLAVLILPLVSVNARCLMKPGSQLCISSLMNNGIIDYLL